MYTINKFAQKSFLQQSVASSLLRMSVAFNHHGNHSSEGKCPWSDNAFSWPVKARVTKPAPHFEGMAWTNNEFKKVSLNDFKGKYVVLFFYPLDFTFVCPTEIKAFNDKAEEFRKNGKLL